MLVGLWMSRKLITISPTATIAEAAVEMERHRIRRLLVIQGAGAKTALLGIVSLGDVARAFPADTNPLSVEAATRGPGRPVSEIMTGDPCTVEPETPIEDAARVLVERKVGALPVVRGDQLVGIITESDLFRALVEVVGGGVAGVRVTFDLAAEEDAVDVVLDVGRRHDMRVVSAVTLEREGRRLGVIKLAGSAAQGFIDDLWQSGHRVVSITRSTRAD
jgi:acetoin utilization protein AcuB